MNRMAHYLQKKPDKMHFIPFITAGDPNEETTIKLALALQELGASVLELGVPYSDPLADGPVIQKASERALKAGMTLNKAFKLAARLREEGLEIPVVIFTYYNLLLQLEESELIEKLNTSDIDGLLVPDLPYEESQDLMALCQRQGIYLINLVAPTTSKERLQKIGETSEGFLYCVSSLGVTGMRNEFHPAILSFLENVRAVAKCPIAVGFGISSGEQVEALKELTDGFIAGSAIVKEVEKRVLQLTDGSTRDNAIEEIKNAVSHNLLI
jgi:tryptophan synthase alpha chain